VFVGMKEMDLLMKGQGSSIVNSAEIRGGVGDQGKSLEWHGNLDRRRSNWEGGKD